MACPGCARRREWMRRRKAEMDKKLKKAAEELRSQMKGAVKRG